MRSANSSYFRGYALSASGSDRRVADDRGVVILTRRGREHRHVANALHRAVPIVSVVVEVPQPDSPRARTRQLRRRYTTGQIIERGALRAFRLFVRDAEQRDRALRTVLGPASDAFAEGLRILEVPDINGPASRKHLEEARPELILVYGTRIVRDQILEIGSIGALNMHTGLSPEYRGSDCAFWPVHDARFDLLGATVHECTSRVDGGAVLGRRRAYPQPGDGLHEIFARCVLAGADLYAECTPIALQAGVISGAVQDLSQGREYRSSMRGIRAEYRARRNLRGPLQDHLLRRGF